MQSLTQFITVGFDFVDLHGTASAFTNAGEVWLEDVNRNATILGQCSCSFWSKPDKLQSWSSGNLVDMFILLQDITAWNHLDNEQTWSATLGKMYTLSTGEMRPNCLANEINLCGCDWRPCMVVNLFLSNEWKANTVAYRRVWIKCSQWLNIT